MMISTALLATGATENTDTIVSLTAIMAVALLAPLLAFMTGKRVPAVVFLLFLGVLIGPEVLGWADMDGGIIVLRELGLGMLFLLAGFEIDVRNLKGKEGKNAVLTWLMCVITAFLVAFLSADYSALTSVTLAIAVTSTALGTLMPILKSVELIPDQVKNSVMIHGAVGELLPVLAIALLLSARATWITVIILILFFAIAILVSVVPRTVAMIVPWLGRAMIDGASATNQTIVRMVILMLLTLMSVAAVFDLDVVLGAFAAGIILRTLVPVRARHLIEERLDVVGYGFLIPIFFICSGMAISVDAVLRSPFTLAIFVLGILIARGLPVFLREVLHDTGSGITDTHEKAQLGLYAATGLPIIVAVTEVAVGAGLLNPQVASILVAGGAVTVLIFPMLATLLMPKGKRQL